MKKTKVLSVKLSTRRSGRRVVKLENGNVFSMAEDVFLLKPIRSGDELTTDDIKSLSQSIRRQDALESGYHLLSYRMRSVAEMRQRLLKKEYESELVEGTINRLLEKGYLDDEKFALMFGREKIKSKRLGPPALKVELASHFLSQEILDKTLSKLYKEYPVEELIQFHIEKRKIKKGQNLTQKEKKRLINGLRRKGFLWDDIQKAFITFELLL